MQVKSYRVAEDFVNSAGQLSGRGKRGGARVIYYWFVSPEVILMLFAYPKNKRDDLTPDQLKQLKKIVEGELK